MSVNERHLSTSRRLHAGAAAYSSFIIADQPTPHSRQPLGAPAAALEAGGGRTAVDARRAASSFEAGDFAADRPIVRALASIDAAAGVQLLSADAFEPVVRNVPEAAAVATDGRVLMQETPTGSYGVFQEIGALLNRCEVFNITSKLDVLYSLDEIASHILRFMKAPCDDAGAPLTCCVGVLRECPPSGSCGAFQKP